MNQNNLLNNSSNSEYPNVVSYFPDDYNYYGRINCGDTDDNNHPTSSIGIYPMEFHYWEEYHTVYFRWYINEDTWNSISSYVHIEINVYDTWGNPSTRNNISSPTCIDCEPPEDAPGPPTLIDVDYIQASRSIKLEYEEAITGESDYFVIYRCLSNETMTDDDVIGISSHISEYYDDSNELKPGVEYKYAVAGVNYASEGLNSNELTVIYGELLSSNITSSTTLSGAYYCNGTTISDNSTVTINSGTLILIKPNKSIIVNSGSKIIA
ncbi:MAG TPA: hypothetical protein DHW42_08290 [Candidatus Marinimicrobia bacterium]|nr:hypothetical protein [Candidatus Neomarinimicrobiota bacterium]